MKAKVKATGEIVEVEDLGNGTYGRIDGPVSIYTKRMLDFNISAPEKTTIEGWVTKDFSETAVELHLNEPHRTKFFQDDEDSYWVSRGKTYEFSDEFFPTITPEKPLRVRIEITLIDEK